MPRAGSKLIFLQWVYFDDWGYCAATSNKASFARWTTRGWCTAVVFVCLGGGWGRLWGPRWPEKRPHSPQIPPCSPAFVALFKLVQFCTHLFKLVQFCAQLFKLMQFCTHLFQLIQFCTHLFQLIQFCTQLFSSPSPFPSHSAWLLYSSLYATHFAKSLPPLW